jgi:hypothetical protein
MNNTDKRLKEQSQNNRFSFLRRISALKLTAFCLFTVSILLLPMSIGLIRTSNLAFNEHVVRQMLGEAIVDDNALPQFIKRVIFYEPLNKELSDNAEVEKIVSVLSELPDDKLLELLDYVFPEKERMALLKDGAIGWNEWIRNENAYPELYFETREIVANIDLNAEDIAGWLYQNIDFPPMSDEVLAKFEAGEFSDNLMPYLGNPPKRMIPKLRPHLARVLREKLVAADIPERINFSDEMADKMPETEALQIKATLKSLSSNMHWFWIVPNFCILIGYLLLLIKKVNLAEWTGWLLSAFGIRLIPCGYLFGNPEMIIDPVMELLNGKVPAVVMAFVESILPELIWPLGGIYTFMMLMALLIGPILLGLVTFRNSNSV